MERRLKLIAYWMYLSAVLCLAGLFWSSGAFEIVIGIVLAALYYQAGTGLIRVNDRDRIIAIVLLILSTVGYLSVIVTAVTNPSHNQAELIASISTMIVIVSVISLYYLLSNNVIALFKGDSNA